MRVTGNTEHERCGGYVAMTVTLLVMMISLTIIGGFTFFALQEARAANAFVKSVEARYVSEGGIEDVIYRVFTGKQYSASETLGVGNGTTTLSVVSSGNQRTIRSEGERDVFQQNLETKIAINATGVSFHYGVQVSDGGLSMSNGSRVNGSIYSNGNVTGSGTVTGDVIVAGGIAATSSYSWEANNADQAFATASASRDIAQSFTATSTGALNRVSVYLKKIGSPTNDLTLRIAADNAGKPQNSSLASAVIGNGTVGASPAWIDVSFASPANLTNGNKYWIILDYNANSGTNYWVWRKDTSDAYAGQTGKYTGDWSSGSASWTDTGADLDFKIWVGGANTKIDGITVGDASGGSGRANLFVNATIHGSACPNAYCIVENPARQEFGISDGVIQDWKNEAAAGGECARVSNPNPQLGQCDLSGNYKLSNGATGSLGPKKVPGNLELDNGSALTLTGTVWVAGEIKLSNNCIVRLAAGYGALSGVLVTDNKAATSNNCTFQGSGTQGSYIMLISDMNALTTEVITVDNNSAGVIYFAPKGRVKFSNNATAKEATAYGITLDNNAVITYESGLANMQFSSGPTGGYSVESWQEVP